jgi:hypothetical protein
MRKKFEGYNICTYKLLKFDKRIQKIENKNRFNATLLLIEILIG